MNKLRLAAALFFLLCSPAEAKLFDIGEFYLDNGLRVLVIPNHKAPIVKHMVWYNAGSMDEQPGKGGAAHLLEHLMFRGTEEIPGNRLNEILEQNGAESNAFTAQDFTAYHQLLDISRLELAMYLEADRMQNLQILPEHFALERDIVFQERQQVVENNPAAYFNEAVRRVLWQDHPYGRPITGMPEEISGLRQEDAEDFYRRYYAPANAVLVLSGDIDGSTARQLATKYYGKVKARPSGERKKFPELKTDFKSRVEMKLQGIAAPRLSLNFAVASAGTDKDDIYKLAVLAKYLAGGEVSALYKDLVLKQKAALAVSAVYDEASRSYGTFSINAVPAAGVSAQQLEEQLRRAIAEAVKNFDESKLEKIKRRMRAGLVYLQDNPADAAYIAGSLATVGLSKAEIENYDAGIEKVTVGGVKAAAAEMLQHAPQVTGILEPLGGRK